MTIDQLLKARATVSLFEMMVTIHPLVSRPRPQGTFIWEKIG
jgi:hypothetical protein